MSAQTATRLTCFAILSAIEEDVRGFLRKFALTNPNFLPDDVKENAKPRFYLDFGLDLGNENPEDSDLLDYLDFGDLAKILQKHKGQLTPQSQKEITLLAEKLTNLSPARNRVCHSRPLEVEDLPHFLDVADDLKNNIIGLDWQTTKNVLTRLKTEPTFVLYERIPEYWSIEKTSVVHNLPLPEFDDTGFVGRKDDRKAIEKYLRSQNPVITILGEGGAGKTALALRCLYDLIDKQNCPFDLIVWISLKTKTLTSNGIQSIQSAVFSTTKLLNSLYKKISFGFDDLDNEGRDKFDQIIEYMTEFKTLLAIDNLETLPAQEIRELYSNIPHGSKLLVTSRVGIGEVEIRYPLPPLGKFDAATLFRAFAKFLNLSKMSNLEQASIEKYCTSLHNNPLLIKWFLSSLNDGADPRSLLTKSPKGIENAISFCFENLYDSLSNEQKQIVHVLSCAGRPVADPELRFLLNNQIEHDKYQWSLNLLHRSSILRNEIEIIGKFKDTISKYQLTDIANHYISRIAKPSHQTFSTVQKGLQELRWAEQEESIRKESYKYDVFSIHPGNKYDNVAIRDLRDALNNIKLKNYDAAMESVERARKTTPQFSEVERVAALIYQEMGDGYRAEEHYRAAKDLNPESGVLLNTYANFLLRSDRYEEGLKIIEDALRLDKVDLALQTRRAQFLMRLGRYSEAAETYENVLKLDPPFQKWKIATLRDTIDNYRRWAEVYSGHHEFNSAREKIGQSIALWDKLNDSEKRDLRFKKIGFKIINDILFLLTPADQVWSNKALDWIDSSLNYIYISSDDLRGLSFAQRSICSDAILLNRLEKIFGFSEFSNFHEERQSIELNQGFQRKNGTISRIRIEKDFGFIQFETNFLFFHRNDLITKHEWGVNIIDSFVTFELSENNQGPCAKKVRIETR